MSSPSTPSRKRSTAASKSVVSPAGNISGSSGRQTPSSRSRGKRKIDFLDEPSSESTRSTAVVRKSSSNGRPNGGPTSPSAAGRRSSQKNIDRESSEEPRPAKRRSVINTPDSKTGSGQHRDTPSHSKTSATSFAEMYTFTTKNVGASPNGLVDLTKSPSRNGTYNGIQRNGFNPYAGPKKVVVKVLKRPASKSDNSQSVLEAKWQEQDTALNNLFNGQEHKLLLEELYANGEFLCRLGHEKELNARVKAKCVAHLQDRLRTTIKTTADTGSDVATLQAFVDAWVLWQAQLQTIRHLFFYLNQTYLVRSPEEPVLDVMGLQQFRKIVFYDDQIQERILAGTVELLDSDRKGSSSEQDKQLVKHAINTYHDLGVYTIDFEPVFVKASEAYFGAWRAEEEVKDLPIYARGCSELLDREISRCDFIGLDRSTKARLTALFDEIIVEQSHLRLADKDQVLDMLDEDMTTELEQVYTLLARKKRQQELGETFAGWIETQGSLIVFDEEHESEMVVRLLKFKRKLDNINKFSFHGNEPLDNTLHKAFEVFMNKTKKSKSNWDTDNAKPGEMIAKHVDLLLKGGPKAVPGLRKDTKGEQDNDLEADDTKDDTEVEKHLDDALDLFRFVHGKAVFEAFYKKDLARRLLMGRTQSFDAERSMLARLRNECGAGFTHNLESMFKDMDLAREEMKSYNQILSDRGIRLSPDLSVNVLSVAAWPTYPDVPVNLPTNVAKAQVDFEKHYKDKHVGRRLHWKPTLSNCQLKSKFPKGNKQIVVSGFQAVVLLLFNDVADSDSLTFAQIQAATALPENELVRTLQSLACARYQVLTKTPRGREINIATDKFSFNSNFTDDRLHIKINQIQLKETKEENKETHQRVAADRHYETQAAIVRIMKSRKVIGHNELIVEVIKATRSRGVLDQSDIKRNIEKLIEKEYMERDEDGKNQYRYLA